NHFVWGLFYFHGEILKYIKEDLNNDDVKGKIKAIETELKDLNKIITSLSNERRKAIELAVKGLLSETDIEPTLKKIDRDKTDYEIKVNHLKDELKFLGSAGEKEKEIQKDLA